MSPDPHTVSVVIPALNEEAGILDVVQRLRQAADRIESAEPRVERVQILVVDDGSTDRTAEIAGSVSGVEVLSLPENRGYGGALKAGFEAAQGDLLAFLDADGTYPPEFLSDLVASILGSGADIILGSRMVGAGSRMPAVRRAGNLFFARLLSWITGRSISDTASGMRIFRREVLGRLGRLPDGLDFTPAMSTSALHERLDIREIPMPYDERAGMSKLNPVTDGLRFLATILRTAHRYNPLKFFGLIGLILVAAGIGYGIGPLAYYLQVQRVEDWAIYRLVAVIVLLISGINMIFFGVVANVILAANYRVPPFRNSLLARILLRPFVIRHLWILGGLLMISALVLNHEGLFSYLASGKVYAHWSYTLTGALLWLLGLSLALWGSLVRVVAPKAGPDRDPKAKKEP
ncbi:MAG: glycosyltransferase family 2 protein [Deltaproteobacteria bacterium]|nr:glycosyltransferase family 2 protein [Deltaproteobacteria bacterium]